MGQTSIWNGSGGDDNWSTTANWDSIPISGNDTVVNFAGNSRLTPNNDLGTFQLNQLNFSGGEFSLAGDSIEFVNNSASNQAEINQDNSLNVEINTDWILTDGLRKTGTGGLRFGGTATGAGAFELESGMRINGAFNSTGSISLSNTASNLRVSGSVGSGADIVMSSTMAMIGGNGVINRNLQVTEGSQSIVSEGLLTINGDLTVDYNFNSALSITGGVVDINGITRVTNDDTSIVVAAGATLGGNGQIQLDSGGTFGANIRVDGNLTASKPIVGTGAAAAVEGTGIINASIVFNGGGAVRGGLTTNSTIEFNGASALGANNLANTVNDTVTFKSGNSNIGGTIAGSGQIVVESAADVGLRNTGVDRISASNEVLLQGRLLLVQTAVVDADIDVDGGTINVGSSGGTHVINGAVDFNGNSRIQAGNSGGSQGTFNSDLDVQTGTLTVDSAVIASGAGSITVREGASLVNNGVVELDFVAQGDLDGGSGSRFTNDVFLETSTASGSLEFDQSLIVRTAGTSTIATGATAIVSGLTSVEEGVLSIESNVDFSGAGAVNTRLGAELRVNGDVSKDVSIAEGAMLSGAGMIAGQLEVEGMLGPGNSAGILDIDGDVVLEETSTVCIEIGGNDLASYDAIDGLGNSSLMINGARLELSLIDGFLPSNKDQFDFFRNFQSLSGQFGTGSNLMSLNSNTGPRIFFDQGSFSLDYQTNRVTLSDFQAVPEPGSSLLLFVITLTATVYRRRARQG